MVVVPELLHDAATAEDLEEDFERGPRRRVLRDGELVLDLPTENAACVPHHRDREASFTVDEADSPLLYSTWSFLLIVRTGRIVTSHGRTLRRGSDNGWYRRMHGVSSI